jgi:hypothetical protein
MTVLERCKACILYQYRSDMNIPCTYIKLHIPYICPCFDCLLISVCQKDCETHTFKLLNLEQIMYGTKLKNVIVKFLTDQFGVNSLGWNWKETLNDS